MKQKTRKECVTALKKGLVSIREIVEVLKKHREELADADIEELERILHDAVKGLVKTRTYLSLKVVTGYLVAYLQK